LKVLTHPLLFPLSNRVKEGEIRVKEEENNGE
jgi:hypothetical protein